MCGIAGFIQDRSISDGDSIASSMAAAMHHRGPDDAGVWVNGSAQVHLAHARLAIVDLSPLGHQPMGSPSGRYTMVFNGEVYNFPKLRDELALLGCSFQGHSDTEVLLNGIEHWGLEKTLQKSAGMFAIALWDQELKTLTLARDRMGEKPLYYGWARRDLVFASELKAIKQHPEFVGEINRDALTLFMRHNAIPAPHSIYQGIYKLPAASILEVSLADIEAGQACGSAMEDKQRRYWDFDRVVGEGCANRSQASDSELIDGLDEVLKLSISEKMVADVPLGAFLSGGYDSTAVVALMQSLSDTPVHTFSIGFHEEGYNEAEHAKAVAQHLGTQHTEMYVRPEQALSVIPKLSSIYDEPFSDSSQIPTFLVSEMTKQHVTVALSGDGGDELFGGYNRYTFGEGLWNKLSHIPSPLRRGLASGVQAVPPRWLDALLLPLMKLLPQRYRLAAPGDKLHKLASILGLRDGNALYLKLLSHWDQPGRLVLGGSEPANEFFARFDDVDSFVEKMMAIDTVHYMADDILTKVDRASMAVSLEGRVPLIDHRVVEFAWQLPFNCKIRNGEGKWILKQLIDRYVPRSLMERPKMGFGVPIDQWLRGELRDWAENLLDPVRLREQNFFNEMLITEKWREHLAGTRNWQYYLWDVLMFQAWLEEQ